MDFTLHPIKREIELKGFHSIYYFEFGKEFSHPPEKHGFWEMVYVDSGEINAVTDGLGRKLRQGQVIFHRPWEVHAHVSNLIDPNNMLVVSFTANSPAMEFFDKRIFTLGKTEKTLLSLFVKEARVALGAIPDDYHDKRALDFSSAPRGSFQLLECYLTEFLLVLLRGGDEASSTVLRSEKTRALGQSSITELIIAYLEENVASDLTLSDICSRFFIGKTQLCKLFDDHVGTSPMEYFSNLKITEAKKLLRREDLSVSRIADMLSYSSIHNFSRAFKKNVGISPSDYRKKIWEKF
ncbi:MAG: helix-turn-helix transcriptional regulator [Ruminococcaceae bacterium]|nr:helix-turn-helix transcriptional regulator [Oscillospiraceae bacterium]